MATLEFVLRTAATLQLALLAALLLSIRRRDHTPLLGAACCGSVAAFVLTSAVGAETCCEIPDSKKAQSQKLRTGSCR